MREVLFRGKRVDNDEWAFGYAVELLGRWFIYIKDSPFRVEVKKETVRQYTGLTDKNRTEIFEGDILDISECWWDAAGPAGYSEPKCTVEWREDLSGFFPFSNYDCDCDVYYSSSEVKVIGNIHDNPELLEKKK